MKSDTEHQARRGIIAPLAAIFLIFLTAMIAFGVDIGWVVLSQTNLQNAADAAALAGAHPLMNGYVQYQLADSSTKSTVLTSAKTSAKTYAKNYASYNSAGSITSLVLNDSDIEFGFMDSSNNYSSTYTGFPNTVKVTLRLDSSANGSLGLFFGPAVGRSNVSLTATASATIYAGTVNSFSVGTVGMLPVTYDQKLWYDFVATGKDPSGTTTKDSNGVPELPVYPEPGNKYKGNFGLISLDDSHAGASEMRAWVDDGMSSADVQALINGSLIPLSNGVDAWDWRGDTGFKSSLVQDVNDRVGQTFIIPLFKPYNNGNNYTDDNSYQAGNGQGSNYDYNIVEFVGLKIMTPNDYNREILIQPAAVIDPNAVFTSGTLNPAGTSTNLVTTFTTPKLTR